MRDTVLVCPLGEVDLATVAAVRAQINELRAAGFARIALDLRRTTFADSTCLGMTLDMQRDAKAEGWEFAVVKARLRCSGRSRSRDWFRISRSSTRARCRPSVRRTPVIAGEHSGLVIETGDTEPWSESGPSGRTFDVSCPRLGRAFPVMSRFRVVRAPGEWRSG